MSSAETEIEDAPSSYKSDVWQHFGFRSRDRTMVKKLQTKHKLFVNTVKQDCHTQHQTLRI